jgi:hypothetical protein
LNRSKQFTFGRLARIFLRCWLQHRMPHSVALVTAPYWPPHTTLPRFPDSMLCNLLQYHTGRVTRTESRKSPSLPCTLGQSPCLSARLGRGPVVYIPGLYYDGVLHAYPPYSVRETGTYEQCAISTLVVPAKRYAFFWLWFDGEQSYSPGHTRREQDQFIITRKT